MHAWPLLAIRLAHQPRFGAKRCLPGDSPCRGDRQFISQAVHIRFGLVDGDNMQVNFAGRLVQALSPDHVGKGIAVVNLYVTPVGF